MQASRILQPQPSKCCDHRCTPMASSIHLCWLFTPSPTFIQASIKGAFPFILYSCWPGAHDSLRLGIHGRVSSNISRGLDVWAHVDVRLSLLPPRANCKNADPKRCVGVGTWRRCLCQVSLSALRLQSHKGRRRTKEAQHKTASCSMWGKDSTRIKFVEFKIYVCS